MTAAEQGSDADPVWTFIQGLPAKARADLHRSQRLVIAIHTAIHTHGWTVDQLIARCSKSYGGAVNIGAIAQHRLDAIDGPPALAEGGKRIHFGCCDGGLIYDETGDEVRVTKCPGNRPAEATA